MLYRILADLTVVIHFGYVMFVISGLVFTVLGAAFQWGWVRNLWFRGVHLAMILVVVFEAWAGITCPLTILEKRLRLAGGQESYRGDFIANWVHDAMFFDAPSWVFTIAYTLFGIAVLATLVMVPPWDRRAQRLQSQ